LLQSLTSEAMGCKISKNDFPKEEDDAFHAKYSLGQKLGEGTFGQVRSTKLRGRQSGQARNEQRAVKIIDVRGFGGSADEVKLKDARLEATLMEKVGVHDNVVRLIEFFESKSLFYIIMEKCDGSLTERLEDARVDEVDVARLFWEMLLGIAHVHSVELVHRDIKPSNYLLFGGGKGKIGTVKLADFGMATGPKNGKPQLTGNCGSAPYMSPEMVSGKHYWQKTDVWSFGVTAYVLIYGDFPYMPTEMTSKAMKLKIKEGVPEPSFAPDPLSDIPIPSQEATDFLRSILQRSHSERFTSEEALGMPFISKANKTGGMATGQSSVKVVHDKRVQYANTAMRSFRTAVQRTQQVEAQLEEKRVDPTVAHSLDELLYMLQTRPQKAFTDVITPGSKSVESPDGSTINHRKYSKSRTQPVLLSSSVSNVSLHSSSTEKPSSTTSTSTDVPNTPPTVGAMHSDWAIGQEQNISFNAVFPSEGSMGHSTGINKLNDEALTRALNAFMKIKSSGMKTKSVGGKRRPSPDEEMSKKSSPQTQQQQGFMPLPTLLGPDSIKVSSYRSKRKQKDTICGMDGFCRVTSGPLDAVPESIFRA